MGEYAEMMLDGTCCQCCGEFLGGDEGYPVFCAACEPDDGPQPEAKVKHVRCRDCTRRFASDFALQQHRAAKHAALASETEATNGV